MTHSKVLVCPAIPAVVVDRVPTWFRFPYVVPIHPGSDHLIHCRRNLVAASVGANPVTNAHIAAVAMEYQAAVHSNDRYWSSARIRFIRRPQRRIARMEISLCPDGCECRETAPKPSWI